MAIIVLTCSISHLFGCGNSSNLPDVYSSQWRRDFEATIKTAVTTIPVAAEIEELFPVCDHFIGHSGWGDGVGLWNTEAFIGGRYVLTMQVPVVVDYERHTFRVNGEATFLVVEQERIDVLSDGRVMTSRTDSVHEFFDESKWREIFKAKDLSPVAGNVNKTPVPGFEKFVEGQRRDRKPRVSLLSDKKNP